MSLFEKLKNKRYDLLEVTTKDDRERDSIFQQQQQSSENPFSQASKETGRRKRSRSNQNTYDKRPFTKYELEQAKKANTTPEKLRAKFKGATYDGPPFARETRKFDSIGTGKKGKYIEPSFFDKRQEFKVKDDGSIDPAGVKQRMGSRFFSAREKQYKATLKQIEADKKAGKDTKALEQKANKYQRFLKKGARGASGRAFLDKLVNRVTSDSIPGGGKRIKKGVFERNPKTIDTSSKALEKRLKDYSDLTEPTVASKAPPATGKKFPTFDGSPAKGLRKGTKARLPMKGGANLADFDPENLPKGAFDPKKNVRGIDKDGFARITDSKGRFIKMKDLEKVGRREKEIAKLKELGKLKGPRADAGGFLTAKVYTGTKKQQAEYKKAVEAGKKKFYKKTESKKIFGVSNKTGDFDPQFKAEKARLDFGGKISPMDGIDDKKRKKILRDLKRQSKIDNPTFVSPDSGGRLPLTPGNMRKYNLTKEGLPKFKTGTFKTKGKQFKTPKFSRTRTAGKLGQYALGAYVLSQVFGGGKGGFLTPPPKRNQIVSATPGGIDFTLAGKDRLSKDKTPPPKKIIFPK